MGRPKLEESKRRQQLNIRIDPEVRETLERIALEQKASTASVAEQYLNRGLQLFAHPAMNDKTLEILVQILDELEALRIRNNGRPWWTNIDTWAASKMVFEQGPFAKANPDDWRQNENVNAAWSEVTEARRRKQEAINLAAEFGLRVNPQPESQRRGLFGLKVNFRDAERQRLEQIEDPNDREQARAIFGIIERFDATEAKALEIWSELVRPWIEEEVRGEMIYKQYRREVAMKQIADGIPPDYQDLL